jgi:hypothetical protein
MKTITVLHRVPMSREARIGLGLEFREFPGTFWSDEELKRNARKGAPGVPCAEWNGDTYVYYVLS